MNCFVTKNKLITLNYIDKVYNNLVGTGQTINSLVTIQIIIDVAIITLCINPGLVDPECSFSGIKFHLPTSFIIAAGAWITGIIVVISIALIGHEAELLDHIQRLYKSLDYEDKETMEEKSCNVLEHPNFMTVILEHSAESKVIKKIIYYAMILVVFILPIFAQLFAAYRVANFFNWSFWITISFLALLLFTIYYVINYLFQKWCEKRHVASSSGAGPP